MHGKMVVLLAGGRSDFTAGVTVPGSVPFDAPRGYSGVVKRTSSATKSKKSTASVKAERKSSAPSRAR